MRRLVLAILLGVATAAAAQLRTIPKEAKHGQLRHLEAMNVELDGKPQRLSPGAQIRDPDNRLVLPTSLTEKVDVGYVLDNLGLVHRVWILSARERALLPKPKAVTLPADK
jgi:hypothetical protein